MATVTGLTAERMLEIENASVVEGEVDASGHLILSTKGGTPIDAGPVLGPAGAPGPPGPSGVASIPGEVKLWPGSTLPVQATYGKWVWADGAFYPVATYPIAAGHIATQWRTFAGANDPGGSNFRVPDLRGLAPVGMDAMPGGARANRMTRSVAITIAGRAGEETHVISIPEMASHAHGGGNHGHGIEISTDNVGGPYRNIRVETRDTDLPDLPANGQYILPSGNIIASEGNNNGHENVQPSVFVPYIVRLDG